MVLASSKKLFLTVVGTAALSVVLQGCGRTSEAQKIETKKGSGDATAGKPCTADSCPKIKFDIQGQGAEGTTFVGYVGESVSWSVGALAADGTQRDIGVFLSGLPAGATTGSKGFDTVAVVSWSPSAKANGNTTIKALVRDLSRCKMVGGSSSKCSDPNASLSDFDQTMDFKWRVDSAPAGGSGDSGAQVVRVSDLSCGGLKTSTSGEVMVGVASAALPAITGILSGNLGAIVPLIPGLIGTLSSGDDQKTPTQC